jgi:hypothetical protein
MTTRGDGLRERDRYGRASLREQLVGELRALRRHPGVILVAVLVFGGGAALLLTRPQIVQATGLAVGDCLYIHAADAQTDPGSSGRRIGSDSAVVDALYADGAERASCDMSHSHEVAAVWREDGNAAAPYPGAGELAGMHLDACKAAFAAYVGHPVDGSALDFVVAVPTEGAWSNAVRSGACLVDQADGGFLSGRAQGSGR